MAAPTTSTGAEPQSEAPKLKTIVLKYELQNAGLSETAFVKQDNCKYDMRAGIWRIGPGEVEVDAELATDLLRREKEYDVIERERLESKDITIDISKATGQVFSGAGFDVSSIGD